MTPHTTSHLRPDGTTWPPVTPDPPPPPGYVDPIPALDAALARERAAVRAADADEDEHRDEHEDDGGLGGPP